MVRTGPPLNSKVIILIFRFEIYQKEDIIPHVVLDLDVCQKCGGKPRAHVLFFFIVRNGFERIFWNTTNEAIIILQSFLFGCIFSQFTKCINDDTKDNVQQQNNNYDKEEHVVSNPGTVSADGDNGQLE